MNESNKVSFEDMNKVIEGDCNKFFVKLDNLLKEYNPSANYTMKLVISETDATITERRAVNNSQRIKSKIEDSFSFKNDLDLVSEIEKEIEEIIGSCEISWNPLSINCESH